MHKIRQKLREPGRMTARRTCQQSRPRAWCRRLSAQSGQSTHIRHRQHGGATSSLHLISPIPTCYMSKTWDFQHSHPSTGTKRKQPPLGSAAESHCSRPAGPFALVPSHTRTLVPCVGVVRPKQTLLPIKKRSNHQHARLLQHSSQLRGVPRPKPQNLSSTGPRQS